MIFEYYTGIYGIVSLKMKQKKGRDSSELSLPNPLTITVLRRGLQTTPFYFYPSHATQSGSVADAAISPLSTLSVLI